MSFRIRRLHLARKSVKLLCFVSGGSAIGSSGSALCSGGGFNFPLKVLAKRSDFLLVHRESMFRARFSMWEL